MDILSEGSNIQKGKHFMSTEDNKALIRRFYEEVFNKKNLAALDDFFALITLITRSLLACQSVPREPGKPSP
jgi:hypothetical protein